ncbi:MAG TPA: trypsin-like peptidase domain-containing protein, partial [Gemmatimonadaceae bacterium]|nr:trypsin-like peptidase domain-containing protein [Gemmatimonadaceae bacterium]
MRARNLLPLFMLGVACKQTSPTLQTSTDAGSVADPPNRASPTTTALGTPRIGVSLAPLAKQVTPAVVAIQSVFKPDSNARMMEGPQIPPGLLPPGMQIPEQPQEPMRGLGSGFIVSPDGYILTNNHVVANAERVTVGLPDGRIFTAKVIGRDPSTEVAVVKIDATGLPTLTLGDDSTTQVGDGVMAVGNPLGLEFTVTSGIISAKGRSGSLRDLFQPRYAVVDFLQTDAVVNPGNSGGPLVDMQGRVIGINTAIASPTGTFTGYSFAVPISIARIIMDEIRKDGHAHHAILGVAVQDVGPADAHAAGLSAIRGVLISALPDKSGP